MKNYRIIGSLAVLVIAMILMSGCTSTSSTSATVPTPTPPTPTSIPNSASSTPNSASSTPPSGWKKLTVTEDNFNIIVPTTWTVSENDISTMPSYFLNTINVKNVKITPMNKIIYLTNQDNSVITTITGVNFFRQNSLNISDKDLLTQFLNALIPSVEQGLKGSQNMPATKEFAGQHYSLTTPTSFDVTTDPTIYTVNGYDVERVAINPLDSNGKGIVHIQIYVLKTQNSFYIIQDSYAGSASSDPTSYTITGNILESFTPTPQ